jgi:hypothetical protein
VLLTNEDWNVNFYDVVRGFGSIYPILFVIPGLIIGNYILFKLFLAILINDFSQASEENLKKIEEEAMEIQK